MTVPGTELYIAPKTSQHPREPSKYQPVMLSSKAQPGGRNWYQQRKQDMQSRPLPSLPNIAEASASGSTISMFKQRKAHLDNFWSEFFEHSAKPRAAMQIFDVAIRWASGRVINFCSMQTLQALSELRFNFK